MSVINTSKLLGFNIYFPFYIIIFILNKYRYTEVFFLAKKKSRLNLEREIDYLNKVVEDITGKKNKIRNWNTKDLINITPLTPPQQEMIYHFNQGDNLCVHGSAGTGKTLISLYLALKEVFDNNTKQNSIKIVRSAVPSRDQGFLPGTLEEKEYIYELPYYDICSYLLGYKSSYQDLKNAGIIDFTTSSYVRSLTWSNCVVIVDEGQNMVFSEINSIITRLGENSKIIFIGDKPQCDFFKPYEKSGLDKMLNIVQNINGFVDIKFTSNDIVRSKFVKSWIKAVEDYSD